MDNTETMSVEHELKRDRLHPNRRGLLQLCDNIEALVQSFHNGHQKINRLSYSQAVVGLGLGVTGISPIPVIQGAPAANPGWW